MWTMLHIDIHIMKTIQMTIDEPLLRAVDRLLRTRKTTRSAFIRGAVEAQLLRERMREQETIHAQGYRAKPVIKGEFDVWLKEQDWGTA